MWDVFVTSIYFVSNIILYHSVRPKIIKYIDSENISVCCFYVLVIWSQLLNEFSVREYIYLTWHYFEVWQLWWRWLFKSCDIILHMPVIELFDFMNISHYFKTNIFSIIWITVINSSYVDFRSSSIQRS